MQEINTGLEEQENRITLSKNRQLVALEAAHEIQALCQTLRGAVTPNENQEHLVVRGLTARVNDLACALMSALSDEVETTAEIARVVGCQLEEEPAGV